jgi:DNA-binding NarL/FixJ family response regulator
MADVLSNHDTAEKLVISERTVDVHLKHVPTKWFARRRSV